ncbi:hypothetical protein M378DRAFT_16239 [Amanita muscaria Koide BX008]|uniref:Uncharacterized protein n=1 Tax=Amanita muscaria (strain Koide BX008) TaxID=946122 RepID=A0A0C2S450_AMAMK|nr:hypothetical protein M378DRAFT_16239 [Amanita muscaria Koide BX008]
MAGIRDPALRSWLHSNHAWLLTLSFIDFMKDLRKRTLDTDWEFDVHREMMMSKYMLDLDFQNWADNIVGLNCILTVMDQHYDDKGLLELLRANLENDLNNSIKNWVEDVHRLADTERCHLKRAQANWDDWQQRSAKRPAIIASSLDRPRPFLNTTNSFSNATNSISTPSAASVSGRVPTLTGEKKSLLDRHQGCRRCRKFYTCHRTSDAICDFPDVKTYKPLTEAMALATKRRQEARPNNSSVASSSLRVMAVVSCPSSPGHAPSPVAAILSEDECIDFGEDSDDMDTNVHPLPLQVKKTVHQEKEEIATHRAACMEELQQACDYCRQLNAGHFESTLPSSSVLPLLSAIISKLESSEEMRNADNALWKEFGAIFEPIPHVDALSDNVQARIVLKDASKTIVTRSYACP